MRRFLGECNVLCCRSAKLLMCRRIVSARSPRRRHTMTKDSTWCASIRARSPSSLGRRRDLNFTGSFSSAGWIVRRLRVGASRHGNRYLHGNGSTNGAALVTGLFDKPEFSSADDFALATEKTLIAARKLVEEIAAMALAPPSPEVAVKMDELSDVLCRVADLSECVRFVHPDRAFRDAAQEASLTINAFVEELNTDSSLHRSLHHFINSEAFKTADEVTRRTTELLMHDFETCGIHLEKEKREKIVELNNKILQLSHLFVSNSSLPTLVPTQNCPPQLRRHFPTLRDGSHVAVDHVPLQSPNSILRSSSYAAYFAEIPAQIDILEELLKSRHEVSKLAGYQSFAHKTLKTCMARNPETVMNFLEKLSEKNLPLAREEVEEMKKFRSSSSATAVVGDRSWCRPIQLYDVQYCSAHAQNSLFSTNPSKLREYFSLPATLAGLNHLAESLFDVTMETVSTLPGEVWSDEVIKLSFVDNETGTLLGHTYLDLFARDGKSITDCHFTIQGGRERNDGSYQLPVIALCCNFSAGGGGASGSHGNNKYPLLSLSAVENLFHEMGHALHSILGRSRYQNVTGTRCSTDFAEIPSTLMELFLSDSRVVQSFAKHRETGRPIPKSDMSYIQLSGKPFPAYELQIQIVQSMTDLLLHTKPPPSSSNLLEFANEVFSCYSPIPPLPGTTWLLRFNHLYGYGARYYSYLWARAVASLIWSRCFADDPFSKTSGRRLRKMLAVGGGVAPQTLIRDLLNFDLCVDDLVDSVHSSILEHRHKLSLISES